MFNGVTRNKFFVILIIVSTVHSRGHKKLPTIKYILQWSSDPQNPLTSMPTGNRIFADCSWDNCFITRSKHYFNDLNEFDAILFSTSDFLQTEELPWNRDPTQKYVFISQEAASLYPLAQKPTGFFNMTWTYKLDSDITFRKIIAKDRYGEHVGPQKEMKWMNVENMVTTDDFLISKLSNKSTAVAWIESNCFSLNMREEYVGHLFYELDNLGLRLDTYGECGPGGITDIKLEDIFQLLEDQYYFYLAFENVFDEDYVTEQLLYALNHFTVPVVYGGANYSRFMPDGMYLNAREWTPKQLAKQINEMIEDKELYYDYFKSRRYYSYYDPAHLKGETEYCKFCEALNDENTMTKSVTYENLAEWWNQPPTYQPQMHSDNCTKQHTHRRGDSKRRYFRNNLDDEIVFLTDNDYPDLALLEPKTEASFPRRAYMPKISKTGSIEKTRNEKSKKKKKYTKTTSSSYEVYTGNIERHEHTHDKNEHDNHEREDHGPLKFEIADRVLEWHAELPEPAELKPDGSAEAEHQNFFFDVTTKATEVYTRNKDYYVQENSLIES